MNIKADTLKKRKGFTLLEVIVSLAALTLMSAFILQMFILSAQANARAKNKDYASSLAMNAIETFKSGAAPEDFWNGDFVEGAHFRIDEMREEFIYDPAFVRNIDFTNTIMIYKYYNKDFVLLPDVMEADPEGELSVDYIGFVQVFYIYSKSTAEGYSYTPAGELDIAGEMVNIKTFIIDTQADEENNQLVNYSAKKYFAYR